MKKQIIEKLEELRDLLGIDESEKIAKQIMILAETLDQYYFTEKQFDNAIKKIVEYKQALPNKMPTFAKFKQLMEGQFFKIRQKKRLRHDFFWSKKNWINKQLSDFCKMVKESRRKGELYFLKTS